MPRPTRLPVLSIVLVLVVLGLAASVATAPQAVRPPTRLAADSGRLREWDARVVRMERDGQLRLRKTTGDTLLPERRHEWLDQHHHGVPVFGAGLVRQTQKGLTVSLTGTVYEGISANTTPVLTREAALAVFARETGGAAGPIEPALTILPRDDGRFVLTYRITAFTGASLPVLFVNAMNGTVELRYDNLRTTSAVGRGRGLLGDEKKVSAALEAGVYLARDELRPSVIATYDMRGNLARARDVEKRAVTLGMSDFAADSDNDWADGAIVDAHVYLGWTYDYFFKRFGRRGLDGQDGRRVVALMHSVKREDLSNYPWAEVGTYFVNAWFCRRCGAGGQDTMMFGEGLPPGYTISGQYYDNAAASLDIVAHEYAHAVDSYSSNLIYRGESGALSEGFADIMSTGTEFFFQPEGTGLLRADYLHGEDARRASGAGSVNGSRSLQDPRAYDDPDHFSLRYIGDWDNGGVHTNGNIASHAFYLAIVGGTNRTSGRTVTGVGGANREQIEKIFYRAFTTLPSDATFGMARANTIESARALYGAASAAERAVTEAWDAVGVF